MYTPLPGQTDLSLFVEGGEPWGATRIHRKLDARWRRVAERLLEGITPAGYSYLFLTGVSSNGETFDLNGRSYELDPLGVAAVGDLAITVADGANAAVTAAAIAAGVNADLSRTVDAIVLTAGVVNSIVGFVPIQTVGDLVGDGVAAGYAVAETMANGDFRQNKAAADVFDNDGNPAAYHECSGTHVVTAQDVANWLDNAGVAIAGIPFTTAPVRVQYTVMSDLPTAAGSLIVDAAGIEFRWRQANTNRWVLECVDLTPTLVAGNVIHWYASA